MRRVPTLNLIIIAVIVMMLVLPMVTFRMKMLLANKVGLFLIIGLVIVVGILGRLGGDHKRKRLAEEERQKQLAARKPKRKLK
jgi:UPF0716 family protein affecting phage T7 exclusion